MIATCKCGWREEIEDSKYVTAAELREEREHLELIAAVHEERFARRPYQHETEVKR